MRELRSRHQKISYYSVTRELCALKGSLSFSLSYFTDIGALMYPNYMYSGNVQLSQDDINGIQAIYGECIENYRQGAIKTAVSCLL